MAELTTLAQTRSRIPIRALNRCGALIGKIRPTTVRPEELIEVAQRRTGLTDFGGTEFLEPLSRLLESCQREAQLNVIGRIALRADVTRTLCNRLLMQQDRQLHPGIARQEIREPLFIVGLPRSGTTLLHTLLAADPAHRVPLTWEAMTPSPPTDQNRDRRIRHAAQSLASLRWLAPTFERVHTVGAELPQECVSLMSPSFMSDQFDTMYNMPTYRTWYLRQDFRPAYEFHRRFLQHLQQRDCRQRWVLKAPAHMFGAQSLLSIYPDARFVQTHRNPIEAVASVSSLVCILRSVFSDAVDPVQVGRDAMEYWLMAIDIFLRERDRLPSERVFDLNYTDIQRDPIAAAYGIYEYFGWPFSPEAEARMRALLAGQSRMEYGNHRYLPSQFGLDSANGFAAYCDRFGLSAKTKSDAALVTA
ncbi:MAG: sulfotransferase [Verrucomicrobiota bacterium]